MEKYLMCYITQMVYYVFGSLHRKYIIYIHKFSVIYKINQNNINEEGRCGTTETIVIQKDLQISEKTEEDNKR